MTFTLHPVGKRIDQEMIRTLYQVADCQSYFKAAGDITAKHLRPSSHRIKTLEENIGTVQLFNRTTRTVTLTPAGEYLLEKCRQWIDSVLTNAYRATADECGS